MAPPAAVHPLVGAAPASAGPPALTPTGELALTSALVDPTDRAWLAVEAAGRWDYPPAPPRGTVAVALSPGRTDAVTVHSSTLTDDTLDPADLPRWRRTQVLRVPVQYGSSS